jgi:ABC-type lipoprotein release transport system permease subunit
MYTNVREQAKEIAILRAMGIPRFWVYRIYGIESFLLVLSSSFLGVLIGVVVGYTMTLQVNQMNQNFFWHLIFSESFVHCSSNPFHFSVADCINCGCCFSFWLYFGQLDIFEIYFGRLSN